jgi:hypothetical protein
VVQWRHENYAETILPDDPEELKPIIVRLQREQNRY